MGEQGSVLIRLEGRIESRNAAEWQQKINEMTDDLPADATVVFDVSELRYISSAGLRILMRIVQQRRKHVSMIEASPEIYKIFETTGLTNLFSVRKRMRELSVEGCDVIGRGFHGSVYRIDADTIVKVYNAPEAISLIESERKLAQIAFLSGVPTAISYDIVRVGDCFGSVFELLKAKSFNDLIIDDPESADTLIAQYTDFLDKIHEITVEDPEIPDARARFIRYIDGIRDTLGEPLYDRLRNLLTDMEEDRHFVHGDAQMKNVLLVNDEPMVIDMDNISIGHPVFELAGLYVTYKAFREDEPDNIRQFLGISDEMADRIWERIEADSFDGMDEERKQAALDAVRTLAYIRFLNVVLTSDLKDSELGQLRIRHAIEHLNTLTSRINKLAF